MTKRLYLEPSDIVLLEGVSEKTARRTYDTMLLLLDKITQEELDDPSIRPRIRPKVTIKEYAELMHVPEEEVRAHLYDKPIQSKVYRAAG